MPNRSASSIIRDLLKQQGRSASYVAQALNAHGFAAPDGKQWSARAVLKAAREDNGNDEGHNIFSAKLSRVSLMYDKIEEIHRSLVNDIGLYLAKITPGFDSPEYFMFHYCGNSSSRPDLIVSIMIIPHLRRPSFGYNVIARVALAKKIDLPSFSINGFPSRKDPISIEPSELEIVMKNQLDDEGDVVDIICKNASLVKNFFVDCIGYSAHMIADTENDYYLIPAGIHDGVVFRSTSWPNAFGRPGQSAVRHISLELRSVHALYDLQKYSLAAGYYPSGIIKRDSWDSIFILIESIIIEFYLITDDFVKSRGGESPYQKLVLPAEMESDRTLHENRLRQVVSSLL